MANGNEKLQLDITAKDNASKVVDGLQKRVDKLESDPVEIEVDADVRAVLDAFDKVTAETKETKAAADMLASALGPELAAKADPTAVVNELKGLGLTIDQIKSNADELAAKLKEAADADVGGKLGNSLGTARGRMDEMADSTRGANSALANMVGNTTQDLGAMTGVVGSLGVGIGQMGEYAADAAFGGEKLSSALLSMAKVAGPMAGLALATYAVSNAMKAIDAREALKADQVKGFTESIKAGEDAVIGLRDRLEEAGEIIASSEFNNGAQWAGLAEGTKDVTEKVAEAGLTYKTFAELALSGKDAIEAWGEGMVQGGADAGLILDVMLALNGQLEASEEATRNAATSAKLLSDQFVDNTVTTQQFANAAIRADDELAALNATTKTAEQRQKDAEAAVRGVERALDDQAREWQELKGEISDEQAWLDMQSTFDAVKVKGGEAMDAVKNKSADAEQKMRDYQSAVNGAKSDVISLGEQIGLSIPQVKSMLLQIDDGDIDAVEARLRTLTRNRTISLQIISRGGAGYGGRTGDPESVQSINSVQSAPATGTAVDAAGVTVNFNVSGNINGDAHLREVLTKSARELAAEIHAGKR